MKAIVMANDIKNVNDISQGGKKTIKGIEAIVSKACDILEEKGFGDKFHYSEIFDSPGKNNVIFREVAKDIEISEEAIRQALMDAAPHIKDARTLPVGTQVTGAAPEAFSKGVLQRATFSNKEALSSDIVGRIEASARMTAYETKDRLKIYERVAEKSGRVINNEAYSLAKNTRSAELINSIPEFESRSIEGLRWHAEQGVKLRGPKSLRSTIQYMYNQGIEQIVEAAQKGETFKGGHLDSPEVSMTHRLPEELVSFKNVEELEAKIRGAYGDGLLKSAGVDFDALKAAGSTKIANQAAEQAKIAEQEKLPNSDTKTTETKSTTEPAANDTEKPTSDKPSAKSGETAKPNAAAGEKPSGTSTSKPAETPKPTVNASSAAHEGKGTKFLGMLKKEGGLTRRGKWGAAAAVVGAASAAYLATRDKPENDSSHTR